MHSSDSTTSIDRSRSNRALRSCHAENASTADGGVYARVRSRESNMNAIRKSTG